MPHTISHSTNIIPSVGVEPTTLGLLDPRSNQLSYEGAVSWCYIQFIIQTHIHTQTHTYIHTHYHPYRPYPLHFLQIQWLIWIHHFPSSIQSSQLYYYSTYPSPGSCHTLVTQSLLLIVHYQQLGVEIPTCQMTLSPLRQGSRRRGGARGDKYHRTIPKYICRLDL